MGYIGNLGNTSSVDPKDMNQRRNGKPLPAGWYRVMLEKNDVKRAEWGVGLSLEFVILDDDFNGRKVFDFLCLEHSKSEEAEKIARIRLRELATAAEHATPDNVEEADDLMARPVMARVYRAKDDSANADPDGRRARVGEYLHVDTWEAAAAEDPTMRERQEAKPAAKAAPRPATRPAPRPVAKSAPAGDWTAAAGAVPPDDDLPF